MFGVGKLAFRDFLVKLFVTHAPEGESSTKHCIQQNATGPDVSWWSKILSFHNDLRTHIRRRATEHLQSLFRHIATAETEVDQLNNASFINDYIFKLDVAMSHTPLV